MRALSSSLLWSRQTTAEPKLEVLCLIWEAWPGEEGVISWLTSLTYSGRMMSWLEEETGIPPKAKHPEAAKAERERNVGSYISQWFHACSVVEDQSTTTLTLWHERAHALTGGGWGVWEVAGLAMLRLPLPPWSHPLILWPLCSSMSDTTYYLRYVDWLYPLAVEPKSSFPFNFGPWVVKQTRLSVLPCSGKVMRWSRKRPMLKKNDAPLRLLQG